MCFNVKEGEAPPIVMDEGRDTRGFFNKVKIYFRECYGIPYYRLYYLTLAIATQVVVPINLFSVFYVKSLHMDMGTYGKCLGITYVISLGLAYPLGDPSRPPPPVALVSRGTVLYSVVTLLGGLFIHDV